MAPPPSTYDHGIRGFQPASLPREDVLVDIPDEAKICPCGCELKRIGEEISKKLQIIPQKVVVKRTIRPKYTCPVCEGTEDSGPTVKIASPPPAIIPKGIATPSLLAYIFTAKFGDALPFYRQTGIFRRFGAEISRGTMSSWALHTAKQPVEKRAAEPAGVGDRKFYEQRE